MTTEDENPPVVPAANTCAPDAASADAADAAAEQTPRSPWIGRIIDDRYRVVELLAEGGMGTVFIAEHLRLRKNVALKTIHPSLLGNDEVAARFAREAMASAQLEHPHVASAMDYGSLPEGGAYLVLELVHGPSLRTQLEKHGAMPSLQAFEIGAQIADALSAAHAMGIVHRDLKPENVLLEARHGGPPIVKVLDFGIARVRDGEEQTPTTDNPGRALTQVGAVMGTPGYMPPEQAVGGVVDERADLYALGVMLWEMLAGHCLFDAPNLTGIVKQQFGATPSVRRAPGSASVPAELAALLDTLLAPIPTDRTHTAAEVRDRLRALASRAVSGEAAPSRIVVPTAFRQAAPKLRATFQPLLTKASLHLGPPVAKAYQGLETLAGKAAPQLRDWTLRAYSWLGMVPRKTIWASGAAALVVLASVVMAAGSDAPTPRQPSQSTAQRVASVPPAARSSASTPAGPSPELAVQQQIDVLANSRSAKERSAAALWLRKSSATTEIPPFAKALARLELGPDCEARTAALRQLRGLDDPRALPAVTHWYNKPRSGCGMLEKRDCYACLRDELQRTHRTLSAKDVRAASR